MSRKSAALGLAVIGMLVAGGCASPKQGVAVKKGDEQIAQSAKAAQAAYEAGGFARAAKFYEVGLARARALEMREEIRRTAFNAAACWLRAGMASNAAPLLVEANREFVLAGVNPTPVRVLQARSAMAMGDVAGAIGFASNAVAGARLEDDKVDAALVSFDLAMLREDGTAAEWYAGRASRHAVSVASKAGAAMAQGRLLGLKGDAAGATKAFETAADFWRDAGNAGEMAAALRAAGESLAKAGDAARAADFLYRAARSFFGQHENVAALQCIEAAMKSADAAKSEALKSQIGALFVAIKNAVEAN